MKNTHLLSNYSKLFHKSRRFIEFFGSFNWFKLFYERVRRIISHLGIYDNSHKTSSIGTPARTVDYQNWINDFYDRFIGRTFYDSVLNFKFSDVGRSFAAFGTKISVKSTQKDLLHGWRLFFCWCNYFSSNLELFWGC